MNDSDVPGFRIWRLAPTFEGSSPLPGVGGVNGPVDLKLSTSRPLALFRSSLVPGTSWSAARAAAAPRRRGATRRAIILW